MDPIEHVWYDFDRAIIDRDNNSDNKRSRILN